MKLTSSQFAAAIGLSPYQSRQKLFRLLTGRENRETLNQAMKWGIDNERRAVVAAEAITGLIFSNTGEHQRHTTIQPACSGVPVPLGTTPDGNCGSTGLEVKCPQKLTDQPPSHYLPQVQGQMWIAGFDTVIFCQWQPSEARAWMIARSEDYILQMSELLSAFCASWRTDNEPKRQRKPTLPDVTINRITDE